MKFQMKGEIKDDGITHEIAKTAPFAIDVFLDFKLTRGKAASVRRRGTD